jgi:hypothetical protein
LRNVAALKSEYREILLDMLTATDSFPGGVTILRALRVTPVLKGVRRASNEWAAKMRTARLRIIFPDVDANELRRNVWLGVEIANSITELIAEREWETVGESLGATIEAAAALLAHHYWQVGTKRSQKT